MQGKIIQEDFYFSSKGGPKSSRRLTLQEEKLYNNTQLEKAYNNNMRSRHVMYKKAAAGEIW